MQPGVVGGVQGMCVCVCEIGTKKDRTEGGNGVREEAQSRMGSDEVQYVCAGGRAYIKGEVGQLERCEAVRALLPCFLSNSSSPHLMPLPALPLSPTPRCGTLYWYSSPWVVDMKSSRTRSKSATVACQPNNVSVKSRSVYVFAPRCKGYV